MFWLLGAAIGGLGAYLVMRGRAAVQMQNEAAMAYKENLLAQRRSAFEYLQYCRANKLPVPLSTDEFYDGKEYRWAGEKEKPQS